MMNAQETAEHGHRVKMAMEIIEPVIDRLAATLTRKMLDAAPMDSPTILALHTKIQAVEALMDDLRQAVIDGETASLISENEE